MPVATPEEEPTVAIAIFPLLHVPPEVASVRVTLAPTQTGTALKAAGNGLTVREVVPVQPGIEVHEIVTVPGDTPVTLPDASTVATDGSLVDHVPVGTDVRGMVAPTHTLAGPLRAGNGSTVKEAIA